MVEVQENKYWCHICEEVIVPVEPEKKCPGCDDGFVEDVESADFEPSKNSRSAQSISLQAPLLLGVMEGLSPRLRQRREMMMDADDDESRRSRIQSALSDAGESQLSRTRSALRDSDDGGESQQSRIWSVLRDSDDVRESLRSRISSTLMDPDDNEESRRSRILSAMRDPDDDEEEEDDHDGDSDHEFQDLIGARRGLDRLLQNLIDNSRGLNEIERNREREGDQGRERTEIFVLTNSNNEAIILQVTSVSDDNQEDSSNRRTGVLLGDEFLGPIVELLQGLAESDLNHFGTPPANKEAVAALPTVNIQETLGCTVCLEVFEIGTEVKEMPCQHKFHPYCIFPWLDLHSSCPVCRFELPSEESRNPCESAHGGGTVSEDGDNAVSSSSYREGTNQDGYSDTVIFSSSETSRDVSSFLSALFRDPPSPSPSDENGSES